MINLGRATTFWIDLCERRERKLTKCGQIADQNRLQLVPAVFSRAGQIHGAFKSLIKEQIRQKFNTFEGQAKPSKIKSPVMK